MDKLIDFEFSAWVDGNRKACCIHAKVPDSKLGYISFYMSQAEFKAFTHGSQESFTDISHNIRSYSDFCTFYNLDFPTANHGEMVVPYVNVNIPSFVRRILLKWAEKQWSSEETHQERPTVKVDQKKLKRWTKLYGHGTGSVNVVFSNDMTQEFFEQQLSVPDSNLGEMVNKLKTIAKNSTRTFWQHATVRLSKDWDGFYFNVPKMCGGIVNHGKENEKPDWSIHT